MAAAKALSGPRRAMVQACLYTLGLAIVAVPPVAVGLSGTASADPLWTALRILALEAFTLVFANVVTGSLRPLFNRVFKAAIVHRIHVVTGLAGFSLAVTHGILVLVFGVAGYRVAVVWVGPAVLTVLVATMAAGFARRGLRRSWRWIHRLNYLVFAAIFVHGTILGADLGNRVLLQVCFGVYAAVVAAGLAYRLGTRFRMKPRPPSPTPDRRAA